jgi:hypothetical protein
MDALRPVSVVSQIRGVRSVLPPPAPPVIGLGPSPFRRVEAKQGALDLGGVVSMRPRLTYGDTDVPHAIHPAGRATRGRDAAGPYELTRYRVLPELDPIAARSARPSSTTLNVRRYLEQDVVVGSLDYRGPPLAPENGIRFTMQFDELSEALALHQFKLHWLAPTSVSTERNLPAENLGLLWRQVGSERYHLLMPLGGEGMSGELGAARTHGQYEVRLAHSSRAPDHAPSGEIPLFVYASGEDPYPLPGQAWKAATTEIEGALREDKPPPGVFTDHLGYCTWEALHTEDCTEENILRSVKWYRDHGVPIGTVIIDDGMQQVTPDRRLASFEADPRRFPGGLASTVRKLKELGVEHVAIWMAKDGYWHGIDPSSEVGRAGELATAKGGVRVPDPNAGIDFYRAYFEWLKDAGISGVKVDNQSMTDVVFEGIQPPFEAGVGAHRMIAKAAEETGLAVLDCMSQRQFNILGSRSNVMRASDDYLPGSPAASKEQLLHLFKNAYFLGPLFHLDGDMFQSHDVRALAHIYARLMLDTFYVSDRLGDARPDRLLPALDERGKRLRLNAAPQLTRDCLIADPSLSRIPMKVFGYAGEKAAVLAAFNVNKAADHLECTVRAADVPALAGERVAIYRRGSDRAHALEPNEELSFELDEHGAELFTMAPIEEGTAVLGVLDKYLGPAAIESQSLDAGTLTVRLKTSGTLAIWLDAPPRSVTVGGKEVEYELEDNLLRVSTAADRPIEIRTNREPTSRHL